MNDVMRKKHKYPVITLCGSTRFKGEFESVAKNLTLSGYCVLSVGCYGHADEKDMVEIFKKKQMLDDIHKQKIRMADAIFVINAEGYIGDSTKQEIVYAKGLGKKIYYYTNPIVNWPW